MARGRSPSTVGVDIGTTSVKAVVADEEGQVLDRVRIPHRLFHPAADLFEHDAQRAWRRGPVAALRSVTTDEVAGVGIAAMVPSLTAVNRRGVPVTPGILYDDARGREGSGGTAHALESNAAEALLRWLAKEAPDARGYWPAQAVAAAAFGCPASIDTAVTSSMGSLHERGRWNGEVLGDIGVAEAQLPTVVPMGGTVGHIPDSDIVVAAGTVDALCDQIVSGAVNAGDVLVICGATLVVWAVTDDWIEAPGLWTVPHTYPGRVLVGGPSNAGGLFVDWARALVGGRAKGVTNRARQDRVPVWIPYLRGERVPYHDPFRRSAVHGLDVTHDADALIRAAYESTGFVVRNMLRRAGIPAQRIVASGGGTRSVPWMQAMADGANLPVDTVGVPEGAALGAAFLARMAAGLEDSLDASHTWATTGARYEPDPAWVDPVAERFETFLALSDAG